MLKSVVDIGVPILVIVGMIVVGLELTMADFRRVVQRPLVVLLAILGQLVLLPCIGWLLVRSLDLQPFVAAGILLVATCPAGAMANVYTQLARGDVALSVTLTAISCLLAGFTMPFAITVMNVGRVGEAGLTVPPQVMLIQLLALLLVPVVVGMGIRRLWPAFANRHGPLLLRVGVVALLFLLLLVIVEEASRFADAFLQIATAGSLLTILTFAVGWLTGWASRCQRRSRFAVGMFFSVRNVGVATAVAVTALGRVEFAVFATAYFLTQVPILLTGSLLFRPARIEDRDNVPEVALP
jgi:BASS family bile acid:Na+ symporter